jgi:hypothetical protein
LFYLYLDNCSSNNSQVLKKIFGNNESIDRMVKNSVSLGVEGKFILSKFSFYIIIFILEPIKKPNESEHRVNV